MSETADHPFAEWAILELLGHRRLAGYVQEVQLAGHGFLRLDIPAAGDDAGRSQFIAPGSVYALHPTDEVTARRAAAAWRPAPVQRWELPAAPALDFADREDVDDGLCGDCMDGKCHGTDPDDCGCARHAASVEAAELDDDEDEDEHPF